MAIHPKTRRAIPKIEFDGEIPTLSLHVLGEMKSSIQALKQLQKSKEEQAQELLTLKAEQKAELIDAYLFDSSIENRYRGETCIDSINTETNLLQYRLNKQFPRTLQDLPYRKLEYLIKNRQMQSELTKVAHIVF